MIIGRSAALFAPTSGSTPPSAGLQGWYYADEAYSAANGGGTKVTTNGSTVLSLKDTSGNAKHWNVLSGSPTLVTAVQNGHPSVRFAGGNYMGLSADWSISQPYTIHLLCVPQSASNDQVILAGSQASGSMWLEHNSDYVYMAAGNSYNMYFASTLMPVAGVALLSMVFNGTSSYWKLNNDATSAAKNPGTNYLLNLYYAKGYYADGVYSGASDVLECLVYNTAQDLDSADVGDVIRNYFNTKYAFGWTIT